MPTASRVVGLREDCDFGLLLLSVDLEACTGKMLSNVKCNLSLFEVLAVDNSCHGKIQKVGITASWFCQISVKLQATFSLDDQRLCWYSGSNAQFHCQCLLMGKIDIFFRFVSFRGQFCTVGVGCWMIFILQMLIAR